MSIFNSLTTAVSGINAQATAFTNLSNNIANSQTVGYKADTTAFQDFVAGAGSTSGSFAQGVANSVAAVTVQHVNSQGTAASSTDGLAMSISGNGLFNVSKKTGAVTSAGADFAPEQYYTRNGEFYEDKDGYLQNTSGYYLDGYMVDPTTGALNTSSVTQINVANVTFRPTQTTTLTATGTLSSVTGATPVTTNTTVYDGTYNQANPKANTGDVTLTWTQSSATEWTVAATSSTSGMSITPTTAYTVDFNTDGSLKSVTDSSGNNVTSTLNGATANLPISITYPDGNTQNVKVNIGTIGGTSGMSLSVTSTTPKTVSDSVTTGTYQSASIESDGSVMATFDNGDTQLIGKVALSNFANVNGLLAQDGQAYTATAASGSAQTGLVGQNATGSLTVGYVESSTTDLTSDLSALIVAQEAYTANTKIVTTADQLLQATIAMKQ
ncbi:MULTISPECIES: flagellar hook protein FlgE [Acetobacter]|jgi:flagellar hook protein FlgE|uniref:Flagellar hook protein FlgE n=1 Tax=Acetobacter lovaniensis TaxID=104100 RepID=A0A841QFZ2_9PROT|nr:flagellar hook-basal body complex protein [Acetobacter lovaniensis]MBB6457174.1 flagellar hook protein FlgE [Acetobacter lovaniensis]MCI1697754.1 flagellar hook-basal body complex protein [Acetobacter lovaniensis]MCI1795897.1 flagellar hook-basal body complex protein [Acetobacter lovaniensis]MCP1239484.1 flagellar hook-basal body complex protein [Acetobacter lovaniensis]NHN81246.1 flagellar hook-basal body complex protein [Acetobacter lovaniensis]